MREIKKLVICVLCWSVVSGLSSVLETTLLICTEFSIKSNDSPHVKINDVRSCLLQGNIKIPTTDALLNAVLNYHDEVKKYESLAVEVSHHEMENRREVRSIQRDSVALLMRLKYFSSAFNVPNFVRLSDGRRLMALETHVRTLKDTSDFVESLPPIMDSYVSMLRNITSLLPLLDIQEQRQSSSKLIMEAALVRFRNVVRAQYVL